MQNSSSAGSRTGAVTFIAAGILAAFYFATCVYIGSHRIFWFDELFTVHIARLPDIRTIWTALNHGVDSQPPFYYMLVRLSGDIFGDSEVAARLPCTLGMSIGLLLIFDCARRLTDGLHGLIALAVATCSFLPYYGYEARPYGLYFMFAALALWVWIHTRDDKKSSAVLFGLVLFLGVTMHYYFVMFLVPCVIWQLLWGKRGQLASPKLIAGVVGAAVPLAVLFPLIQSFSHSYAKGFWNRPSIGALRGIFAQIFPDGLSLLALIVIWLVVAYSDKTDVVLQPMPSGEIFGWLFLCIPLAGFVVAELKTNAFYGRYFIGVLPGVAVAFACWVWRNFRNKPAVSVGIFLLLGGWGMATQIGVVRNPASIEATGIRPFIELQGALGTEGKRYVVFSSPLLFIGAQYYSNHPEECILLLPSAYTSVVDPKSTSTDPDPQHRANLGSFADEVDLSAYYPFQFWKIEDLRNHAEEVVLIEPTPDALKDLKQAGLGVETRYSKGLAVAYLHR